MVLAELKTAVRYALPVLVVVVTDALSSSEIKQGEHQGGRKTVRFSRSDFAAVAEGLGVPAGRAETVAELDEAVADDLSRADLLLVDALVDASNYPAVLHTVWGGPR
jgi:thiamine pyrophosphate-dependent acetolactate synthase large subunit-like protein